MIGSLKTFWDVCAIHRQDIPVAIPVGAGLSLEDTIYMYNALPLLKTEFEVDGCRLCFVKEKAFVAA